MIYPVFTNSSVDQNVYWKSSNPLNAKIGPFKYDENGYPVYKDDEGKSCARIIGYRTTGEATITCYSALDESISSSITLSSSAAIATSMTLNIQDNFKISVNEQIVISAHFNPENTHNKRLNVTVNNSSLVEITNNDTTAPTIKGLKMGKCHMVIKSLSNESLRQEFDFTITAEKAINNNNFSDFHQFLRKFGGHFALFLVTSIFGSLFFYLLLDIKQKEWISFGFNVASGLTLATISEIIQHFVPGRNGAILDVGIDMLGYIIGAIATIGTIFLIKYIMSKKRQNN